MSTQPSAWLLLSLLAFSPGKGPSNPTSNALRNIAEDHGKSIIAAAQLMPAAKYDYHPTPAQRTFGQLVAHIVDDAHITCSAIAGVKVAPQTKLTGAEPKAQLVIALQSAIGFCNGAMAQVTDATLADTVTYYGDPAPRVQALAGIADDWADHYAQQASYLRLNGILPPTAKPSSSASAVHDSITVARDGQRDFDFEIGTWAIDMKRLAHPLSGSSEWITPAGYSHIVQKVWDGRASLAQLRNDRPSPHYDGLMLRLYDPQSHNWNVYWGSSKTGALDEPLVGHFANGRGDFFMRDTFQGKAILVRVTYSEITATSFRTEQAFSPDDGKTWETNMVQTFTRQKA